MASPHSIYPHPHLATSLVVACTQHQSVTASTSRASHHNTKNRRLCPPFIYLYVCLSLSSSHCLIFYWNKMLTSLSPSDFSSIYYARLCLFWVLFSNAKPPLGAESVNRAPAEQGVANCFGYTQRRKPITKWGNASAVGGGGVIFFTEY